MIKVVLPYPPSTNHYLKRGKHGVYKTQEAQDYLTDVGWICRQLGLEPMQGELIVTIDVYRPRRSGDLDNRAKCALDALQGHAYRNDNQIVELHMHRHDDRFNPRVEVRIAAGA